MGSASVPSSTSTYQQQSTGLWGSPEAIALAKPILKPALQNIKNQQTMLAGVQSGDPTQTAKFFGLPTNASTDDIVHAISGIRQGPTASYGTPDKATTPTKTAAQGGIMSLGEDADPRKGYAPGGKVTADSRASTIQAKLDKNPNAKLSTADYNFINNYTDASTQVKNLGSDAKATINPKTGQVQIPKRAAGQSTADYTKSLNAYANAGVTLPSALTKQYKITPQTADSAAVQKALTDQGLTASNAYIGRAGYAGLKQTGVDEYGNPTYEVTNDPYNRAFGVLKGMETQPGQFGQATDLYNKAAGRSWTDPGTAQSYMNPYMQTALQSQEDLANRQFAQQQNQLRSRAAQAGAFGGSGSALAEQAAQQNQNLNMQNLVAQGMNQAYSQGMGQFTNEQGQMLGAAGGLGALGSNIGNYNLNLASGLGQAGSTLQGMLTNAANQTQTNASNITQGPTNQGTTGINMLAGTGGGNAGYGTTIQKTQ